MIWFLDLTLVWRYDLRNRSVDGLYELALSIVRVKDHFVGLWVYFDSHWFDWLALKLLQTCWVDYFGNQVLMTVLYWLATQFHVVHYGFAHQRLTFRLLIIIHALSDTLENLSELRLLLNCSFKLIECERVSETDLRHSKMVIVFAILIFLWFRLFHFQWVKDQVQVNCKFVFQIDYVFPVVVDPNESVQVSEVDPFAIRLA